MENMNDQFDRIKQLFTEERLYGNLVENDNVALLTEQEKQERKMARGAERAKRKLERKLKNAKSKEEIVKASAKFEKKVWDLWRDYSSKPKAFNTKKLLFKNGDLKLYGHKDKSNELMLVSLGKGVSAEEGSKGATELILSYYKEKFGKVAEDIEVTEMTNNKFKSGKEYIVFSVIDNSDLIPSQEDKSTDDSTKKSTEKTDKKPVEKPVEKVNSEKKPVEKTVTKQPKNSKGDFTKPLQKLGGAQKGFTYELVSNNKAVKKDGNGEVVATYIRESKFNKKSLFESALRFDLKNTIIENWKWVEGDKTFSDSMSKKFDDAIAQIGSGSSASSAKSTNSDVDGAGAENTELEEEWKNFPCVYNNPNKKADKRKDGTTSFLIKNVRFFNNGRCADTKNKEMRNYKCDGEKIVIGKGDKKSAAKSDKPVEGKVINNIEVLTGDDSWWANLTQSNFTAALSGGYGLAIAAALPDNTFVDRRKGVKGLVDALDGWVGNEDLAYVGATLNYFKDKKYKDPVSGQLVPAITKIKELYKEDEGEDLIADIQSVGTKTLSNVTLKDGTKVSPDQFKEIVVNSIR